MFGAKAYRIKQLEQHVDRLRGHLNVSYSHNKKLSDIIYNLHNQVKSLSNRLAYISNYIRWKNN